MTASATFRRMWPGIVLSLSIALLTSLVSFAQESAAPRLTEKQVKSLGKVDEGAVEPLLLSPNGARLAYTIQRGYGHNVTACDGKESREYALVFPEVFRFSPDSQRFVYWARTQKPNKDIYVLDGVEIDRGSKWFAFSPDSRHIALTSGETVIRDGIPEKVFCVGKTLVFSPDSKHLAYVCRSADRCIVCDGKKGKEFKEALGDPVFAPNSKSYAYTVSQGDKIGDKWVVFWKDRKVGGPFDMVEGITFAPDSRRIAYRANAGGKWSVIVNDKKGPDFSNIGTVVFSCDGKHMAYRACDADGWLVVCDAKKGPACTDVGDPVFSADGKHLAYRTVKDGKALVICDGRESASFDDIKWVGFTPNSNHLAFAAARGNDRFVVCDGVEGPSHERLMVPEEACDIPFKIRYVVIEKNEASLVEVDWPADRMWESTFRPSAK